MREIEKNVLFLNFTLKPPVTILGNSSCDIWTNGQVDKRTSGQTDYLTNGLLDKRTIGQTNLQRSDLSGGSVIAQDHLLALASQQDV
jgi:hypothetical protein